MYYSQDNQDKMLNEHVFLNYKKGVFVDVGAHNGISINNTLFFEKENDWNGINIEPIPTVYKDLCINRPKCVNINCAVSNKNGVVKFINNTGATQMISGIKDTYDPRHINRLNYENSKYGGETEIIDVNTKKLSTILNENNIQHINYLSIDVEGGEFEVIKSINFDEVFIDVIGFENNYNDTSIPIIQYLENKNYNVFYKSLDIFMIHFNSKFIKNIKNK